MEGSSIKKIQSVSRAIEILKCFEQNEELGVTEISKLMDLHKSTTFGLISTLESYQILEKNEITGKYKLGIELFRLGTKVNFNLRNIARPYLEEIVENFKETVNLVIRDGVNIVYLEKIESPHSMRICTEVGQRLPIYCTAVGKAIMATLSEKEIEAIINKSIFIKFTEKTINNKEEIINQVLLVKHKGYGEDIEEFEEGLTCVAAPIKDYTGIAKSAISVSGPSSRMTKSFREKIGRELVQYTNEISKKLGYR